MVTADALSMLSEGEWEILNLNLDQIHGMIREFSFSERFFRIFIFM